MEESDILQIIRFFDYINHLLREYCDGVTKGKIRTKQNTYDNQTRAFKNTMYMKAGKVVCNRKILK